MGSRSKQAIEFHIFSRDLPEIAGFKVDSAELNSSHHTS